MNDSNRHEATPGRVGASPVIVDPTSRGTTMADRALSSWNRPRGRADRANSPRPRPTRRPGLEQLEGRLMLASDLSARTIAVLQGTIAEGATSVKIPFAIAPGDFKGPNGSRATLIFSVSSADGSP